MGRYSKMSMLDSITESKKAPVERIQEIAEKWVKEHNPDTRSILEAEICNSGYSVSFDISEAVKKLQASYKNNKPAVVLAEEVEKGILSKGKYGIVWKLAEAKKEDKKKDEEEKETKETKKSKSCKIKEENDSSLEYLRHALEEVENWHRKSQKDNSEATEAAFQEAVELAYHYALKAGRKDIADALEDGEVLGSSNTDWTGLLDKEGVRESFEDEYGGDMYDEDPYIDDTVQDDSTVHNVQVWMDNDTLMLGWYEGSDWNEIDFDFYRRSNKALYQRHDIRELENEVKYYFDDSNKYYDDSEIGWIDIQ